MSWKSVIGPRRSGANRWRRRWRSELETDRQNSTLRHRHRSILADPVVVGTERRQCTQRIDVSKDTKHVLTRRTQYFPEKVFKKRGQGQERMALNLVTERREPSGEVRESPTTPDGLRRSATNKSVGLSAIRLWAIWRLNYQFTKGHGRGRCQTDRCGLANRELHETCRLRFRWPAPVGIDDRQESSCFVKRPMNNSTAS